MLSKINAIFPPRETELLGLWKKQRSFGSSCSIIDHFYSLSLCGEIHKGLRNILPSLLLPFSFSFLPFLPPQLFLTDGRSWAKVHKLHIDP